MNFAEAITKRTKELLIKTGKSQYKLAKETCLDRTTLQAMFKGKTKDVKGSTIYLIAQSFGMTLTEFFDAPYFNDGSIDV